jgi:hypothetical protein
MKRTMKLTVPAVKPRHHAMLFDADLPFRGRREPVKTQYRRRPKNRRDAEDRDW